MSQDHRLSSAVAPAEAAARIALVFVAVTPTVMIFATRAAPLMLTIATAAGMVALVLRRETASVLAEAGALRPLLVAAGAALVIAAVSLAWAPGERSVSRQLLEFGAAIVVALTGACVLPQTFRACDARWLAAGLALAILLVLVEEAFDMPLRGLVTSSLEDYRLNRVAVSIALLIFPAVAAVERTAGLWWAAVLFIAAEIVIAFSASQSALLALLVGLLAGLATQLAPKLVVRIAVWALPILVLAAPAILGSINSIGAYRSAISVHIESYTGVYVLLGISIAVVMLLTTRIRLTYYVSMLLMLIAILGFPLVMNALRAPSSAAPEKAATLPEKATTLMQDASAAERAAIWHWHAELLKGRWFQGFGFDASREAYRLPAAAALPPESEHWLSYGHPHSAPLQFWFELGIAGALALAAGVASIVWLAARLAPALHPAALGSLAAASVVASVSHGAWQGWWWCLLGIVAVWFRLLDRQLSRVAPDTTS